MYVRKLIDARTDEVLAWNRFTGESLFWDNPVWRWVQQTTARLFDCDLDDVSEWQNEDGQDYVTVHGQIVARVR
jgi:hypothetical protein